MWFNTVCSLQKWVNRERQKRERGHVWPLHWKMTAKHSPNGHLKKVAFWRDSHTASSCTAQPCRSSFNSQFHVRVSALLQLTPIYTSHHHCMMTVFYIPWQRWPTHVSPHVFSSLLDQSHTMFYEISPSSRHQLSSHLASSPSLVGPSKSPSPNINN